MRSYGYDQETNSYLLKCTDVFATPKISISSSFHFDILDNTLALLPFKLKDVPAAECYLIFI